MTNEFNKNSFYTIGEFLFDLDTGILSKGEDEQVLPRLTKEVLSCLILKAPEVVSQDELIADVWKGQVVTDENLQQRITLVRKALGDSGKNPRFIETVRGVGYQVVAEVEKVIDPMTSRANTTNNTSDVVGQNKKRASNLATFISSHLQKLNTRFVKLTSFIFVASIAISILVDGEVTHAVTEVNHEVYPNNVFDFEHEHHSSNHIALKFYVRGKMYYKRYRKEDNHLAIQLFEKSIQVEEECALPYAGLANALLQGVYQYDFPYEELERALSIIEMGMNLDPELAELHKAQGLAFALKGHYRESIDAYHQAVQLDPKFLSAITNLAFTYREVGKLNKALEWHKIAISLNPTGAGGYQHLAQTYAALNMTDESEYWFSKTMELRPDYSLGRLFYARFLIGAGEYQRAISQSQEILKLAPNYIRANNIIGDAYYFSGLHQEAISFYQVAKNSVGRTRDYANYRLGLVHAQLGEFQLSSQSLKDSLNKLLQRVDRGDQDPDTMMRIATIYAVQEDNKLATQWLRIALEAGYVKYHLAMREPAFQLLASTPEFQAVLTEMKFKLADIRQNSPIFR
ncbi:MAG: winged helix-turn-helix domain-containing protein [Kangiellaceae bacterium]|nr:winged helix-turn-helix domain-containing protein [Kangiellaceae bacterium]